MDTTRATAARIEAAREEAGISRLALSRQSGIPRSTLNRLLDGFRPANTDEIESIAAVLSVQPTTLVEFVGVPR